MTTNKTGEISEVENVAIGLYCELGKHLQNTWLKLSPIEKSSYREAARYHLSKMVEKDIELLMSSNIQEAYLNKIQSLQSQLDTSNTISTTQAHEIQKQAERIAELLATVSKYEYDLKNSMAEHQETLHQLNEAKQKIQELTEPIV